MINLRSHRHQCLIRARTQEIWLPAQCALHLAVLPDDISVKLLLFLFFSKITIVLYISINSHATFRKPFPGNGERKDIKKKRLGPETRSRRCPEGQALRQYLRHKNLKPPSHFLILSLSDLQHARGLPQLRGLWPLYKDSVPHSGPPPPRVIYSCLLLGAPSPLLKGEFGRKSQSGGN